MAASIDLLRRLSWRAEKLYRQRGQFNSILWMTVDERGRRSCYETHCEAPNGISDRELLDALREETRTDFARDRIVQFATAYLANVTTVKRASVIHLEKESVRHSAIILECHARGAQPLVAQRDIVNNNLAAPVMVHDAPSCWNGLC